MFNVKVFTIFPELFPGCLEKSVIGRALQNNIWTLEVINLRDFAYDKHKSVDDVTFGGGPGMVMRPDIIDNALLYHYKGVEYCRSRLLFLSPKGKALNQSVVNNISECENIGILCGRFEGNRSASIRLLEF